jgi:hypothetical protein
MPIHTKPDLSTFESRLTWHARASSVAVTKSQAQAGKPAPVLVASAETQYVPVILRGLGTVRR